jgi:hypothetical protein
VADEGVYVYAVSRALPRQTADRIRGVGDAPVRVVEREGLAALVSTVGLAEFGEEALRNSLEDLAWLEATARAHHAVIDTAAAVAPTLPLRLATVYRNDRRVREVLEERGAEFSDALDRITGHTEWGVKGYADLSEFASATAAEDTAAGSPGVAYLRRRREEQRSEEDARREAALCAEGIDTELRGIAAAGRLHPPQDPQLSGHRGLMILNAAYLVADGRAEEFRTVVARLSEGRPGIRLQVTGPWAPYSFAAEGEP